MALHHRILSATAVAAAALVASPPGPVGDQPARAAGADGARAQPSARFALDGPRGTTVLRNRRYLPHARTTVNVYRRNGTAAPAPAVLLVHGGGWSGGGRRRMAPVATAVARAGMVAVNVSYTLAAPGWAGYPQQPRELRAALRWTRRNARRLGVDRHRVGALGSSAGGHLAALLATSEAGLGAAVLWSAPLDLPALSWHRALGPAVTTLLGCPLVACPDRWAGASPLAHAGPGDPPLLVINSRAEMVPAGQAERFAARLRAAAVPHELWLLDGRRHAREYAAAVLDRSIAFLRERLRP